jgi:tRNA modification GTPase
MNPLLFTVFNFAFCLNFFQTDDIIEQEGIRRARVAAKDAHVCVIVVDATDPSNVNTVQALVNNISTEAAVPSSEIERVQGISTATTNNNQPMVILVSNKIDLTDNGHENSLNTANDIYYSTFAADSFPKLLRYNVSCTTGAGVDEFLNALTYLVFKRVSGGRSDDSPSDNPRRGEDEDEDDETSTVITRARHRYHVQEAVEALKRFEVQSQQGLAAVDLAAEELRLAASELGRVVGAVDVEDVLDVLFADFCIGK